MPTFEIPDSVMKWINYGERGVSSESIVQALFGIPLTGRWGIDTPHDPSDLRRCLLLLRDSPETAARFQEMQTVSPRWKRFVKHWSELERVFLEEAGDQGLDGLDWSAPRTFEAMQQLGKDTAR
jgi:hypothetical protein